MKERRNGTGGRRTEVISGPVRIFLHDREVTHPSYCTNSMVHNAEMGAEHDTASQQTDQCSCMMDMIPRSEWHTGLHMKGKCSIYACIYCHPHRRSV